VVYAYERDLTSQDSRIAQNIAVKLNKGGYSVLSLITDLTRVIPSAIA
jgi:hypothetical protein